MHKRQAANSVYTLKIECSNAGVILRRLARAIAIDRRQFIEVPCAMNVWPHDDNAALIAFYGDPMSRVFAQNLVPFTPPWQMSYKDDAGKVTLIKHFVVHRKCFDALTRIFAVIWRAYGNEQARIEADNLHWFGGCYAQRNVRGSSKKLSTHAFAAAIDIDPEHEPMNRNHISRMPQVVIDAFKAEGAFWGGRFKTRQDPMHFQFATE